MYLRSTAFWVMTGLLAAPAVGAGPLQVTAKVLTEQKTRAADGSVRVALVPARRVVPGDRVVFVLGYRNTGSQPIGNIVLDNPVPAAIAYRGPSPSSAAPDVSVDGKTYGPLETLRVRLADGATRAAAPDDVTSVRWRLANTVPAGAQGQLSFQAVLK